jgi:2-polyprenyl-3-methyl-5-hydroxy-6-metoxy-1,4-benzoquinol methylase
MSVTGFVRKTIDVNVRLSARFDALLPEYYRVDGNRDFKERFAHSFIHGGIRLVDVGGGKRPFLNAEKKTALGIYVTGIDISQRELDSAPPGAYDATVCTDIATYRGNCDADVLVCQAVLEHVRDVKGAFAAFASILKPGGVALVWVPSRYSIFSLLNLLFPESLKQKLLFSIFPNTKEAQGFPSYYDQCTPARFRKLAQEHGFIIECERLYYSNKYFYFFAPLHIAWRAWLAGFRTLFGESAAETFSLALRKTGAPYATQSSDESQREPLIAASRP